MKRYDRISMGLGLYSRALASLLPFYTKHLHPWHELFLTSIELHDRIVMNVCNLPFLICETFTH